MPDQEMFIDMPEAATFADGIHSARERTWGEHMIDGSEDPRIIAAEREAAAQGFILESNRPHYLNDM